MRDKYIFDIPVYRKSPGEFDTEINTAMEKRVEHIVSHDPERRRLDRETHQRVSHAVIAESGGPWQFNQIVGWLRLLVDGGKIGCHPWWLDSKRLSGRMKHKRYYLQTPSDILGIRLRNESADEIFDILLKRLSKKAEEPPCKNHYVDLDIFCRIGPFINWREMLDQMISKNRQPQKTPMSKPE